MTLSAVIDELVADLPWGENVRLAVGSLASRESVKDVLLSRAEIVPSWMVGSLADLAVDILKKNKGSVDNSLHVASQCDALQMMAAREAFKQAMPGLSTHLKDRSVAKKIARFVTALDRSWVSEGELDAVIECLRESDPERAQFIAAVAAMWGQGQLVPWSDGLSLRRLVSWLDEQGPRGGERGLPRRLWLWGFDELTPLEEMVLAGLARQGVEVRLLVPRAALETLEARARAIGMTCEPMEASRAEVAAWEPHSIWDEAEFLRDALARLREKGVPWRQIAVFVPEDDLYKRYVRQKLQSWNVPLRDPALADAWKDRADWLWWRDLLRVLASGLKPDDLRAWLGPGPGRHELYTVAYKNAVHGGTAQWARLAKQFPLPELRLAVEAMSLFKRAMTAADFKLAVEALVGRVTAAFGADRGGAVLAEFAEQVATERERPFLDGFRARLPRFVPLFEEFLEAKGRFESVRADGVQLVGHGVWLAERPKHAFVLGACTLQRARRSVDVWDWASLEARRVWDRVHFGFTFEERARRDEALKAHGLREVEDGGSIVFSGARHDAGGKPLPEAALYRALKGDAQVEAQGGHGRVGWARQPARAVAQPLARPDLAPRAGADAKPLRISAFEDYLKCPFIYYGRHVLGLEPEPELGLDADARARGSVLHKVLERFLSAEIAGEQAPPSAATRASALARLEAIVADELAKRPLSGMFRYKPLVDKAGAMILAEAARWLDWEIGNRAELPALRPRFVEKPVELTLSGPWGALRVHGRADRVDSDGAHSVVIDYKTGSSAFIGRELLEGMGAQLLMYAQGVRLSEGLEPAAAYYLKLGKSPGTLGGVFLKRHQKTLHKVVRNSGLVDTGFDEIIGPVFERWNEAAGRLVAGDFAARPARPEKDCPRCPFKSFCGIVPPEDADGDDEP